MSRVWARCVASSRIMKKTKNINKKIHSHCITFNIHVCCHLILIRKLNVKSSVLIFVVLKMRFTFYFLLTVGLGSFENAPDDEDEKSE